MVIKRIACCFLALVIYGCSGTGRQQSNFRNYFQQGNYKAASELLESSQFKAEKEHQLLYLMEKASLFYAQERYHSAAKTYDEANQLVDKLYTKSIRKQLLAATLNAGTTNFYGSIYERSLLYYYQAMSFYHLSKRGWYYEKKLVDGKEQDVKRELTVQEKKKHLGRVRASLVAWNSFYETLERSKSGKTFLKRDLFSKMMAAKLHEVLGTKRDQEIALQLYRDSFKILKELGPTQKVFNEGFKQYNADLKKVYNKEMKRKSIKSRKITKSYKETLKLIKAKIYYLGNKVRPNKIASLKRQYKIKNSDIDTLEANTNVSIVIEEGLISRLVKKEYAYTLRKAIENTEDPETRALIKNIGIPVLTLFALGPLGLGHFSHHGNVSIYSGHSLGTSLTQEVGIEFYLPFAEASQNSINSKLLVYQGPNIVKEVPLNYMTSLSDTAFINAQERIANSFVSRATRIGVKYAAAIAAAYATYTSVKQAKDSEFFAKIAATAQFVISQKAIKESESVDTRHWTTLPSSVLASDLKLKPGEYRLELVMEEELAGYNPSRSLSNEKSYQAASNRSRKVNLGDITVSPKQKSLFAYRAF